MIDFVNVIYIEKKYYNPYYKHMDQIVELSPYKYEIEESFNTEIESQIELMNNSIQNLNRRTLKKEEFSVDINPFTVEDEKFESSDLHQENLKLSNLNNELKGKVSYLIEQINNKKINQMNISRISPIITRGKESSTFEEVNSPNKDVEQITNQLLLINDPVEEYNVLKPLVVKYDKEMNTNFAEIIQKIKRKNLNDSSMDSQNTDTVRTSLTRNQLKQMELKHQVEKDLLIQNYENKLIQLKEYYRTQRSVKYQKLNEYVKQVLFEYYKEKQLKTLLFNELIEIKGNIRVFCRVRPFLDTDNPKSRNNYLVVKNNQIYSDVKYMLK